MPQLNILAQIVREAFALPLTAFDDSGGFPNDRDFASDIRFQYRLVGGSWTTMINGLTDVTGIAATGTGDNVVLTRDGADLEIANTSGATVTVELIQVASGTILTSGSAAGPSIVPQTSVSIDIPNEQVLKINSITFKMTEVV